MGLDGELTVVLRDVVEFLEQLRETKLPINLESVRKSLLVRSKDALTMFMVEKIGRVTSSSPEPYLNMNVAGSKGFMGSPKKEFEEEYVSPEGEERKVQEQDYYESFQGSSPHESANATVSTSNKEENETALISIYSSLSAAETKAKSKMFGALYRKKDGKKLFFFEQYRSCYVALVESYLLVYGNDRDNRPCLVLPIRDYMARALRVCAPNATPRDQRRNESTFEIYSPGAKTFQFIAKSKEEMEEWVMKISESGGKNNEFSNAPAVSNVKINDEKDSNFEEDYQDVGSLNRIIDTFPNQASSPMPDAVINESIKEKEKETDLPLPSISADVVASFSSSHNSTPPPLPARIPRRLPSLPAQSLSYKFSVEEEEEGIYHKIEDLKNMVSVQYGNIGETFQIETNDLLRSTEETYDDVRSSVKDEKGNEKEVERNDDSQNESTYDDTVGILSIKDDRITSEEEKVSSAKSINIATIDKVEESPVKSPEKKSFLDRVRSKRDSSKKLETSKTRAQTNHTSMNGQELAYYDDVKTCIGNSEDQEEYTCPPPPRPICTKHGSPMIVSDMIDTHEDVVACGDKPKSVYFNHEPSKTIQTSQQETLMKPTHSEEVIRIGVDFAFNETVNSLPSFEDNEHYKTPRVDGESLCPNIRPVDQTEELYDDVAILVDFTKKVRKRASDTKGNESVTQLKNSPEKGLNRFISGKKSKTVDPAVVETNSRGTEEPLDDFNEKGPTRMNTFQKLISKVENSLGKASARAGSSILSNKTNSTK